MSGRVEAAEGEANYWKRLHALTVAERDGKKASVDKIKTSLIVRLSNLANENHCSKNVMGWFSTEQTGSRRQVLGLRKSVPSKDGRGRPAIALKGLEHLQDGALLTLSVLLDPHAQRVLEYSIGVQGQRKRPERAWYARIDLTEKPKGAGLCGHPLLHCHVGETPDEHPPHAPSSGVPLAKAPMFTARVPLPWMMPVDALDWLLATVHSPLDRA